MSRLILIFLLSVGANLHAANWYVDNSATGSNNGTSWTAAWKSFSDVVWGGAGVKAGDTLFISGGVSSKTYKAPSFSVDADGIKGSPITLRVGQDAGHNGTVMFNYVGSSGNGISINRSYIIIDGEVSGESRWHFANLYNVRDRTLGNALRSNSAEVRSGLTARWLTFTNVNRGLWFTKNTGTEIHNNRFQQIRGDAAITLFGGRGKFGSNLIYSNSISLVKSSAKPPGESGSYGGPDGIQASSGTSIYYNTFNTAAAPDGVYTSTQHQDLMQMTGSYHKIYGNALNNIGDSGIDYDVYNTVNLTNVWIYNNTFRIAGDVLTSTPGFIRVYSSGGSTKLQDISNFKLWNNTFVDCIKFFPIRIWLSAIDPTGIGNEIKNNLFYNAGRGTTFRTIDLQGSDGWDRSTWTFANNLYYHDSISDMRVNYLGRHYSATDWTTTVGIETGGTTAKPTFTFYAENSTANDFHLGGADVAARGKGVDLSAYFATDMDGVTRSTWSIGAFESTDGNFDGGGDTPLPNNVGVWIEAEKGLMASPFVVSGGVVVQNTQTADLSGSGRLAIRFNVTQPGDYAALMYLEAPSDAANSIFFNIDSEPTDPFMVWDIPVTSGFEALVGGSRGNGTFDSAEFLPRYFPLAAGEHELIIRGREPGVRIDMVMISRRPEPTEGASFVH